MQYHMMPEGFRRMTKVEYNENTEMMQLTGSKERTSSNDTHHSNPIHPNRMEVLKKSKSSYIHSQGTNQHAHKHSLFLFQNRKLSISSRQKMGQVRHSMKDGDEYMIHEDDTN